MAILRKDTPIGFEFRGPMKTVTSFRTWLFSGGWPPFDGWPARNVHTDAEFAKRCGLPGRAASGAMFQGYLAELMISLFGEEWLQGGRMELKFIQIVRMNETLVSKSRVGSKEQEEAGTRFGVDLWCENQHGEKVVVGTGTGWIR